MIEPKIGDYITQKSRFPENRHSYGKWEVAMITDADIVAHNLYYKYIPKHIYESGWEIVPKYLLSPLWRVLNE